MPRMTALICAIALSLGVPAIAEAVVIQKGVSPAGNAWRQTVDTEEGRYLCSFMDVERGLGAPVLCHGGFGEGYVFDMLSETTPALDGEGYVWGIADARVARIYLRMTDKSLRIVVPVRAPEKVVRNHPHYGRFR